MDDQPELQLRRKAIRLLLQGIPPSQVLKKTQRGWTWLNKWRKRFDREGPAGLKSQSRRPQHTPTAASPFLVRTIVQVRRRLVKQKVGLIGPGAIQHELRKMRLGQRLPSLTTIKRVLRTHQLVAHARVGPPAYFPKPLHHLGGILHAVDWTCHYLEGGEKVYALHTLNLHTRACHQTLAPNKGGETVCQHCFETWKTLGIPHFLQLDNDAAFCGGYKTPRLFGQFVRLALYLGIELIFLPVAEPECNGEVEELNGLWGRAAWNRQHFASSRHVSHASARFMHWYMTDYAPPFLNGLTPAQAQRTELHYRLTVAQLTHLPASLPITAGRIHFIRKVQEDGTISILNETWKVGQRWRGQYVWATLTTHCRRLEIWYQRSAQHEWRLLKVRDYALPETVARLKSEFVRPLP